MSERRILGRFIVMDPKICHGKPTYAGSRVMVWQVLRELEDETRWEEIRRAWPSCEDREFEPGRSALISAGWDSMIRSVNPTALNFCRLHAEQEERADWS